MCLLQLLLQKKWYGYELLKKLHQAFPDTQESALYAILRELLKAGSIEAAGEKTDGGPPRKYYRITGNGECQLNELLSVWRKLLQELKILGIF